MDTGDKLTVKEKKKNKNKKNQEKDFESYAKPQNVPNPRCVAGH